MATSRSDVDDGKCIRWGILGCASIAQKNIRAILQAQYSSKTSLSLVAIASRSHQKARGFAVENELSPEVIIYEGYENLLKDNHVDAVYIPLPTTQHIEWVVRCANAKKHVLCEKPAAIVGEELLQMFDSCDKNSVLFMDGVMFMHHNRLKQLRSLLSDKVFGEAIRVSSSFSFNGGKHFLRSNIRTSASADPLGALGDLGWYCIRIALIAFSSHDYRTTDSSFYDINLLPAPKICRAFCHHWNADGVPLDCEATISFGEPGTSSSADACSSGAGGVWDKVLRFDCSFLVPLRQKFEICCVSPRASVGDKIITCDDFVIPRSPNIPANLYIETICPIGALSDLDTRVSSTIETVQVSNAVAPEQEVNMFVSFSDLINRSRWEGEERWANEARYWKAICLLTQFIADACLESMKAGGCEVNVKKLVF